MALVLLRIGKQTSSSRIPADMDMASIESPRLSHVELSSLAISVTHRPTCQGVFLLANLAALLNELGHIQLGLMMGCGF